MCPIVILKNLNIFTRYFSWTFTTKLVYKDETLTYSWTFTLNLVVDSPNWDGCNDDDDADDDDDDDDDADHWRHLNGTATDWTTGPHHYHHHQHCCRRQQCTSGPRCHRCWPLSLVRKKTDDGSSRTTKRTTRGTTKKATRAKEAIDWRRQAAAEHCVFRGGRGSASTNLGVAATRQERPRTYSWW